MLPLIFLNTTHNHLFNANFLEEEQRKDSLDSEETKFYFYWLNEKLLQLTKWALFGKCTSITIFLEIYCP